MPTSVTIGGCGDEAERDMTRIAAEFAAPTPDLATVIALTASIKSHIEEARARGDLAAYRRLSEFCFEQLAGLQQRAAARR